MTHADRQNTPLNDIVKSFVLVLIFGALLPVSARLNQCPRAAEFAFIGRVNGNLNPAISAALTTRIGQLYNGDFSLKEAFTPSPSINPNALAPAEGAEFLLNSYLSDAEVRGALAPELKHSLGEKSFRKLNVVAARAAAQPDARQSLANFHTAYLSNPGSVSAASRALARLFGENPASSARSGQGEPAASGSFQIHPNGLAPAAADDKEQLLSGLWNKLNFVDHGKPGERDALVRIYSNILKSPTGRQSVGRLLEAYKDITPDVGFYPMEGSLIFQEKGKNVVAGIVGLTAYKGFFNNVSAIKLNELLLETNEDSKMLTTLAHELLGHAALWPVFMRAGLRNSFSRYIQDEIGARLLEFIVALEAGFKADNDEMWRMVDDPVAHRNELTTSEYAEIFDLDEMRKPAEAYRRQLRLVEFDISGNGVQIRDLRRDYDIAARLRENQSVNKETLKLADQYIQNAKEYLAMKRKTLLDARTGLRIGVQRGVYPKWMHRNDQGKPEEEIRHPLYRRFENQIERLRARLKKLLRGRAADLRSENVTLPIDEIRLRYFDDVRAHPDHAIPLRPGDPDALLEEIVPLFK